MSTQYFIDVVEIDGEKVERTLGPYASERLADRTDDGLTRQLNHERYFTQIRCVPATGNKVVSIAKWRREALERVWMSEVENRLPFQSNARAFVKLAAEGLLECMESSGRAGFGSLSFRGWQLTHAGRHLYCSSCEDKPVDELPGT